MESSRNSPVSLCSTGVTGSCHAEIPIWVLEIPAQVPILVPQVLLQMSPFFSPCFSSGQLYPDVKGFLRVGYLVSLPSLTSLLRMIYKTKKIGSVCGMQVYIKYIYMH